MRRARGAGSPISLFSLITIDRADDLAGISAGGPKMSVPLSSLDLASEICFLVRLSESLSNVPLSSRCFATSGIVVGFLGEIFSSVLKEI